MPQPRIQEAVMQRLSRVAHAYEMPVGKMLTHILMTALDELEGKHDAFTVAIPVAEEDEHERRKT